MVYLELATMRSTRTGELLKAPRVLVCGVDRGNSTSLRVVQGVLKTVGIHQRVSDLGRSFLQFDTVRFMWRPAVPLRVSNGITGWLLRPLTLRPL